MQQMPRRRQGQLNNGEELESSLMDGQAIVEENKSGVANAMPVGTYNYLHKKFKKLEPVQITSQVSSTTATLTVTTSSSSGSSTKSGGNPSLEALFQVTDHELQKIQSSNGIINSSCSSNEEEKKKGHVCPYCGLYWDKPSVLQKHIRAHTNERPFPCHTCGFAFKTKSNLYKHCKTQAHHKRANNEVLDANSLAVAEPMETDDSEMEEDLAEENSCPQFAPTLSPNHGTIYKPKFHSVLLVEAGPNSNEVVGGGEKSPKLATPEFLQQHITKLISQNSAIVDTFEPNWQLRYKRQSSVPANIHLAEQMDYSIINCSKESSRLMCDEEDIETSTQETAVEMESSVYKSKNSQNPEGSIIKDLLLKTRVVTPSGSCMRLSGGSLELLGSQQLRHVGESEEKSLYKCHNCSIHFKSIETLEAHKLHYCSQAQNNMVVEGGNAEAEGGVSQVHKPRGRPKGSKNRPKKEESRVYSKSVSEGGRDDEVSRVTSRRNSIALGEGTESIKDILTSSKWNEEAEVSSLDGPILKKHLLQGDMKVEKNLLPIKKQKFEADERVWNKSRSHESSTKTPMRTNNSVHLYGGEVEILDEGNGATKRIVIDSQFYNGSQNEEKTADLSSSVVATIAKPVHNSGGTVLQVQDTSLKSLKGPVCISLPTVTSCSVIKSVIKETSQVVSLGAVSRPSTLSLNASHSFMMGTTLVSPETPRPNKKYGQCYSNGQYYTYLEMKNSTKVYYCCIHRPQPMYIPQATDPKLSMYSVWQTVPPTPDPFGLTPSRAMELYKSSTRSGCIYSMAPRVVAELTLTHSTYWTFQQQKKEKENVREKVEKEKEKEIPPPKSSGGIKMTEEYTYVRGRGRGKYICHECGIRCKKPSMLKKHVRTHTDVRPYTCKQCNFSFKTKGNLTKHMKSKAHHKKCVELGIDPVPITIDDAQIDEEAVQRQERIEHQRKQFANDEDSEIDEDEEEEEEEDEYDEEARFKEGEDEEDEDDVEDIEVEGQFDDAPEESTVIKLTHSDHETVAKSLLDLGQHHMMNQNNSGESLPGPDDDMLGVSRIVSTSRNIYCHSSASNAGEYEQPIDLSLHHNKRPTQEEIEAVEEDEDEEEPEQWSEDDSEDIVVDDEQPNQIVPSIEKKVIVPNNPWPATATGVLTRPVLKRLGSNFCQPSLGVTQIFPSTSVMSRSQANNAYIQRSMEDGKCVCTICNKSFSKPSQLRLHFNIHYFERPFRCDSCAISFRTKGHLQKHRRSVSHYNKVNMNMTFGTPTTDNPRPFKCPDCKIAFRIHGHLAKHLRSKMHIMKLECLGKLPFGTYAEIERSGVNLNEIDTTDCENSLESLQVMAHRLVDKTSTSNISWRRERTISGGSCDNLSDGVPYVVKSGSEEDLSQPIKNSTGVAGSIAPDYEDISDEEEQSAFRCHLCGKRTKSAKSLQLHLYIDHSDNNNEAASTTNISAASVSKSAEIAKIDQPDIAADPNVESKGGNKSEGELSCELCRELCSSQQDLSQHLLSHARCRPFICSFCDAAFTSIQYLKVHLVTHQQGIVFGCEECGGSFGSVSELELHMDRRHGLDIAR